MEEDNLITAPLIKLYEMDKKLRKAKETKFKNECRNRLKNRQSMKWVWLSIMKGTNEHTR
jgi:hypothetical protein|tara:strand:- start:5239 stop:5418 length:180 start_codon:yes stop_codon:yes gene_type:complete